jgi:hypothetical protein
MKCDGVKFKRIFLCFLFLVSIIYSQETLEYSLTEAVKVLGLIDKIQQDQENEDTAGRKNVVVSENELNSYIAYRIDMENEEIMKVLRLKLFEKNKIEGMIQIDLRGQKLPKILRPQMTLFFAANFQVKGGNIQFNIKKLFLGHQRIPTVTLDLINFIAGKIQGYEVAGINDWYELPYGITDVKTTQGEAVFYY